MTVYRLREEIVFPDPEEADSSGLLAVGGGLESERLILAYSMGIFPWYSEGEPILWFSPDPRLVVRPDRLHVSRRFARWVRGCRFRVTLDRAFSDVIRQCRDKARKEDDGTWITEEMVAAYSRLHERGVAHSVEVWEEDVLVGGLYGVSLGACFFGESMFHHRAQASKVAFIALVRQLGAWGFAFLDGQLPAPHLEAWGGEEISRSDYLRELDKGLEAKTRRGRWRFGPGENLRLPPKLFEPRQTPS